MKKNFDLHRLSMVLRWDILTNWQRHLGATAGLAMLWLPSTIGHPTSSSPVCRLSATSGSTSKN